MTWTDPEGRHRNASSVGVSCGQHVCPGPLKQVVSQNLQSSLVALCYTPGTTQRARREAQGKASIK